MPHRGRHGIVLAAILAFLLPRAMASSCAAEPAAATTQPRSLTAAEAQGLLGGKFGGLILDDVAELPADAAVVLARYRGRRLSLNGLAAISDETAAALAAYRGDLSLDGLREVSEPAIALFTARKAGISLRGLTRLTPEDATALAASPNVTLAFPSLVTISPDVAAALAQRDGKLWLDGLTTLPLPVAEALARQRGMLSLGGLRDLSPEAAQHLARRDGDVHLGGLRALDRETAEAFTAHRGDLHLDGIEDLTAAIAAALARHGSVPSDPATPHGGDAALARRPGALSLRGLRSLTSVALARHMVTTEQRRAALTNASAMIRFDRVETISPAVACELALFEGALHLNGLRDIPRPVAMILAQHRGGLSLDGVERLGPEEEAALADYGVPLPLESVTWYMDTITAFYSGQEVLAGRLESPLSMQGLRALESPRLARRLVAQAQERARRTNGAGRLRLDRVESLSLEAAQVLATFGGTLHLTALTSPSPAVRAVLAARTGRTHWPASAAD